MPDHNPQDHGPLYIHEDEMDWEMLRFPGQHSKMVFHPTADDPTHPNAGFVRYEPGAHHPRHRHQFAQVWYVLEGRFRIGSRTVGPGTVVFHADPHYEDDLSTETGGVMFFVQYQGPTTGGRPIYDGRFNVAERKPLWRSGWISEGHSAERRPIRYERPECPDTPVRSASGESTQAGCCDR